MAGQLTYNQWTAERRHLRDTAGTLRCDRQTKREIQETVQKEAVRKPQEQTETDDILTMNFTAA